ncbi:hypothetical protein H072_6196 [Dactylellina haptotyla CBS 200.50]|uniref:Uncharacterized protein n=1 Tax=Dactylellina haptotyla (strain CBS 200.50) TaxID=1284197 RepID=S8AAD8_DACHA|nr:hypothetical protein H072_6196 [Dactylellina haptotyla CBS 200.50]
MRVSIVATGATLLLVADVASAFDIRGAYERVYFYRVRQAERELLKIDKVKTNELKAAKACPQPCDFKQFLDTINKDPVVVPTGYILNIAADDNIDVFANNVRTAKFSAVVAQKKGKSHQKGPVPDPVITGAYKSSQVWGDGHGSDVGAESIADAFVKSADRIKVAGFKNIDTHGAVYAMERIYELRYKDYQSFFLEAMLAENNVNATDKVANHFLIPNVKDAQPVEYFKIKDDVDKRLIKQKLAYQKEAKYKAKGHRYIAEKAYNACIDMGGCKDAKTPDEIFGPAPK